MNILVAGAGIGGLSAALCLSRSGHQVQVFEQAPEFAEVGAGVQCGANAVRVLDQFGLLADLEALSVDPERVDFRDGVSGATLYSMPLGNTYRHKYGAPYLHIHRAHLHSALLSSVKQSSNVSFELAASVRAYDEFKDRVELQLSDGRRFSGDCLVGADGVKSLIRDHLLGTVAPRFTGNVAWRGVVPADKLPPNFMQKITSNFMGQGKHMVIYYLKKQQLVNFVAVVESNDWRDESWVSQAPWEELKSEFDGWHSTVQLVIDAMDRNHCFRWALYDHKPFKNWSSKRITLLGDAAHTTLPFMASGAAMAIEDARVLQRALDQTKSESDSGLADGLQLYQRNRIPRTAKVQTDSARFGKLYHIPHGLPLKLAFRALHTIGKHKERFLPEYDANTVKLR